MKKMKKILCLAMTVAMLLSAMGAIPVSAAAAAKDSVVFFDDFSGFDGTNLTARAALWTEDGSKAAEKGTGAEGTCMTYTTAGMAAGKEITTYVAALLPEAITSGKADIHFNFNNEMAGGQLRVGVGELKKNWNGEGQAFKTERVHLVTFLPESKYGVPKEIGGSTGDGSVNIKDGYEGTLTAGWHAMDLSVDLDTHTIQYYLDGAYQYTATLNAEITQIYSLPMLVTAFSGSFSMDNVRVKYASESLKAQSVKVNTEESYIDIMPDETLASGTTLEGVKLIQCGGDAVDVTSVTTVGDTIRVSYSEELKAGREYYVEFGTPLTSIYGHTLKTVLFNAADAAATTSVVTEKEIDFEDFTADVALSQNQTEKDGVAAVKDYVVAGRMSDSTTAFSIDASTIGNTNSTAATGKALKWGLASDQVVNAAHWLRFIDTTATEYNNLPKVDKRYFEFDVASNSNSRMYLIGADRRPNEDESQTTSNYSYVMLRASGTGSGINMSSGQWYHIKIEIDNATSTGSVYVNGSDTATATLSYSSPVYGVAFRNVHGAAANYLAFDNWKQYYVAETPSVQSVRYCAGSEETAINTVSPLTDSVKITFSTAMDEASLKEQVSLSTTAGTVATSGSLDEATGKIYTLSVTAGALTPQTAYTLTIGANAKTAGGATVGADVVYNFATTVGTLEFSNLAVNILDNELTAAEVAGLADKTVTVTVASKNATGNASSACLIFAAYYDDELVDVHYESVTVPMGIQTVSSNAMTVKSGVNIDTVKAFLWEDMASLSPILSETIYLAPVAAE